MVARLEDLLETAKAQTGASDAGEALFSISAHHGWTGVGEAGPVRSPRISGIDIKSQCSEMMDEIKRNVDLLRQRAVDAGALRNDVSTRRSSASSWEPASQHARRLRRAGCQRMVRSSATDCGRPSHPLALCVRRKHPVPQRSRRGPIGRRRRSDAVAPSQGGGSGRSIRPGSAPDSPGARALPPRTDLPAPPR